jgi:hypothetical protein
MKEQGDFVAEREDFFIYFYIEGVDAELADDLHDYLYEHAVNARDASETLYVGHGEIGSACYVIRYGIELENATRSNVDAIKKLVTEHTNAWVASQGGADCVL